MQLKRIGLMNGGKRVMSYRQGSRHTQGLATEKQSTHTNTGKLSVETLERLADGTEVSDVSERVLSLDWIPVLSVTLKRLHFKRDARTRNLRCVAGVRVIIAERLIWMLWVRHERSSRETAEVVVEPLERETDFLFCQSRQLAQARLINPEKG
jgi:hypothetical protein